MKTKPQKIKDAIFIVTQEDSCPLYSLRDELRVSSPGLSVSSFKPGCLILAEQIMQIVSAKENIGGFSAIAKSKKRYECGGCKAEGKIYFEYKKDKGPATLQMQLLNEVEAKKRQQHLEKFFHVLRALPLFEPLDDDALTDLTLLLDLKTFLIDKIIVKEGSPGNYLYILLKGKIAVKSDDGSTIAELGAGEVFGEMSLLSGEPLSHTFQAAEPSHLAMLSIKNFKQVIVKYPVLQIFLFKMLIKHLQMMTLRSGTITSEMSGDLSEIAAVDLFQLINSSQKTGTIEIVLGHRKALVFFKDGQIIYARYLKLRNKDAVFALLDAKHGQFIYTKGIPEELNGLQPINEFMGLIMEGLQQIDERNGGDMDEEE